MYRKDQVGGHSLLIAIGTDALFECNFVSQTVKIHACILVDLCNICANVETWS